MLVQNIFTNFTSEKLLFSTPMVLSITDEKLI